MEKIEYSPEKSYTWKVEDQFNISGKELEVLHNTLSSIFNTNLPQAQMYVMLHECFKISSALIQRSVEQGIIKEAENKQ